MTQDYYGTKRVTGWTQYWTDPDGKDHEGYAIKYDDGYITWSPKATFEAAYQPLSALTFGHALVALEDGHRVARSGWNGKGMWLVYVNPAYIHLTCSGNVTISPNVAVYSLSLDDKFDNGVDWLLPWIGMKTADGGFVPWLASQTDVLAKDWCIIE